MSPEKVGTTFIVGTPCTMGKGNLIQTVEDSLSKLTSRKDMYV